MSWDFKYIPKKLIKSANIFGFVGIGTLFTIAAVSGLVSTGVLSTVRIDGRLIFKLFLSSISLFGILLSGSALFENHFRQKFQEQVFCIPWLRQFTETKYYFFAQFMNLMFFFLMSLAFAAGLLSQRKLYFV